MWVDEPAPDVSLLADPGDGRRTRAHPVGLESKSGSPEAPTLVPRGATQYAWLVASLQYLAWFFGGAAAANGLPHAMAGLAGRRLPTPFASPPFRGLSSPAVNLAWGLFNLLVAYVLLVRVGDFDRRDAAALGVAGAGFALMALQFARSLRRIDKAGSSAEDADATDRDRPGSEPR